MQSRRSLDQLHIHAPCHEAWDAMDHADAGQRFCRQCDKHVHDLATMTRAEATALVNRGTSVCVRMTLESDGTLRTRETAPREASRPAGARRDVQRVWLRRVWLRRVATVAATLGLGSLFNLGCDRTATASDGRFVPPNPPPPGPMQTLGMVAAPANAQPIMGKPATPPPTILVGDIGPAPATQPTPPPATQPTPTPATQPATRPVDR